MVKKRSFVSFTAFLLVAGGVYAVLDWERVTRIYVPWLELRVMEAVGAAKSFSSENAAPKAEKTADQVVNFVSQKAGDAADKIVDQAKSAFFSSFQDAVDKKVDSIGSQFGVTVQNKDVASPVAFSIKKGTPANFALKNLEDQKAAYTVYWKDGSKENGEIAAKGSVAVSHSWKSEGEYEILFKLEADNIQEYKILIFVF